MAVSLNLSQYELIGACPVRVRTIRAVSLLEDQIALVFFPVGPIQGPPPMCDSSISVGSPLDGLWCNLRNSDPMYFFFLNIAVQPEVILAVASLLENA